MELRWDVVRSVFALGYPVRAYYILVIPREIICSLIYMIYISRHESRIVNCRDVIPGINKPLLNSTRPLLRTPLLSSPWSHCALLSLRRWIHYQAQRPPIYREPSILCPHRRFQITLFFPGLLKRKISDLLSNRGKWTEATRLRTACGVVVGRRNTLASNSGSWI